ncbi:MAG: YeeE/YedE family protein [Deltaproteobacteria bacterium]|jgi:hypothetical protein|nr:YeeE/YedE family protein [Deltaproteobacteria bacterium]MBW2534554.1 YeeE/YedE family protein [Deltaproteobacteria bacterium]
MSFPIEELTSSYRTIGMVVAVLIGFGFGFVLERAGFGRSTKLAAQFYGYDMTVFKVMFGAIVTAMLGLVALDGLGIVELSVISESAASATFIWPMLIGGFALGAGFIISGYCPGTSLVATASGNLDGLATISGVAVGSLVFAESVPLLGGFPKSGAQGQLFLYQWLGLSPALLAIIVTVVAVLAFVGAEAVERVMTKRIAVAADEVDEEVRQAKAPKRFAFGLYAAVAVAALVTMLWPVGGKAHAAPPDGETISASDLARRIFDEPWSLRILDLRTRGLCETLRVPGSECAPADELDKLGLAYAQGQRALVLVSVDGISEVPTAAAKYPGKVLLLDGGFAAWKAFALDPAKPLAASATDAEREAYQFQASVQSALAGRKAPPPPKAAPAGYVPKQKKGGGCG